MFEKIMESPFEIFERWYQQESAKSSAALPGAVCLSTAGLDGFPNARFVSLKGVQENNFVVAGSIESRKGKEIEKNNAVALTFWWPFTERHVRVQGKAFKLNDARAEQIFRERDKTAQAVSYLCRQGAELRDAELMRKKINELAAQPGNVPVPASWGGYRIEPLRIEFLEFSEERFHWRKLYTKQENNWLLTQLQP